MVQRAAEWLAEKKLYSWIANLARTGKPAKKASGGRPPVLGNGGKTYEVEKPATCITAKRKEGGT